MCTHPVAGPEWRLIALPTTAACASKRACRGSHAGRAMLHGRVHAITAGNRQMRLAMLMQRARQGQGGQVKEHTLVVCHASRNDIILGYTLAQRTTYNLQHAACSVQRAIVNLQHATYNKPMRHRMQSSIRNAACDVANADDLQPSAALAVRSWLCTGTSPTPSGWRQRWDARGLAG